ncbi:MAG: GNAT family N-acetyltransferase [Candidatus Tumulicola sp.]
MVKTRGDAPADIELAPFDERRDSFEDLTNLLNAAYRPLGDMGLNYVAVDQGIETTRQRVRAASACWVAKKNGDLVGTICYYKDPRHENAPAWYHRNGVCYFGQFAVDPSLQRLGIGSRLLAKAEERAIAEGNIEFACDTADRADHLIATYVRRGFRIVGTHKWGHSTYGSVVLSKRLGIGVRPATQTDYAAILAISNTTPWEKSDFLQRMLARNSIDVAYDAAGIVGFNAWNREFFSRPLIWLVVVDPAHRAGGIGSLLVAHTERACKGTRLYSSTNRSNVRMQHFHEERGYRVCGEVDLDPGDPEVFYCIDL